MWRLGTDRKALSESLRVFVPGYLQLHRRTRAVQLPCVLPGYPENRQGMA